MCVCVFVVCVAMWLCVAGTVHSASVAVVVVHFILSTSRYMLIVSSLNMYNECFSFLKNIDVDAMRI